MQELRTEGNGTKVSVAQRTLSCCPAEPSENLLGREADILRSLCIQALCGVFREMQEVSKVMGSQGKKHPLSDFHGPGTGPEIALTLCYCMVTGVLSPVSVPHLEAIN